MSSSEIAKFFYELGHLSRVSREGWKLLGVTHPESVAEHSLRAAQIAYVLACLEKYPNPHEVVTMVVFHDIGECRVGDVHKLANRYVRADEETAVVEMLSRIGSIGDSIKLLWDQIETRNTTAGILAKDADLLDLAVKARELVEQGFNGASEWYSNASTMVQTASAKELIAILPHVGSTSWWHGLKRLESWTNNQ